MPEAITKYPADKTGQSRHQCPILIQDKSKLRNKEPHPTFLPVCLRKRICSHHSNRKEKILFEIVCVKLGMNAYESKRQRKK